MWGTLSAYLGLFYHIAEFAKPCEDLISGDQNKAVSAVDGLGAGFYKASLAVAPP